MRIFIQLFLSDQIIVELFSLSPVYQLTLGYAEKSALKNFVRKFGALTDAMKFFWRQLSRQWFRLLIHKTS